MHRKSMALSGLVVLLAGCQYFMPPEKHPAMVFPPSSEPSGPTTNSTATTAISDSVAPVTKQSMMDQADDLNKKGNDLMSKAIIDNNPDEKADAQKLIDEATEMMQKAKTMPDKSGM